MDRLEQYYNKFNEDKRLRSRHGQVEYRVTAHYIQMRLRELEHLGRAAGDIKILDVGAATGGYAIPLSEAGYDVTAVEPVRHNLGRLRQNGPLVHCFEGRAESLRRFEDCSFDIVLLFGPMYHIKSQESRLQSLMEAKRVLRPDGRIFISYISNEYSVITYAFKERHIKQAVTEGMLDEQFHCTDLANPLYDYARVEDIYALSDEAGLAREKILSADGAANYMRTALNSFDEEEFELFVRYQLTVCERAELLGAGTHILDILRKEETN